MQIGARQGREDKDRCGGFLGNGEGDGNQGDNALDEQGGMDAERASGGENAHKATGEVRRPAGEKDVGHCRAGKVDKAGPRGGAEGEERGGGKEYGGKGGIGRGDGGAAYQKQGKDEAELRFDGRQANEHAPKPGATGQEQDSTADERRDERGVLVFEHILQAGGTGCDRRDEPPGLAGKTKDERQEQQRHGIESEDGVPGGEPVERRGQEQIVGRVAPKMVR